ncbi:MAG: hydroxymethylglutaryl-CoA lyase [Alphaproteobacteria bacterium]|nr:hydroxymethylglutaryl-CoA lyase [Alphaproteobacteria bacterium]
MNRLATDEKFVFVNEVGPRDGLQNQAAHVTPQDRIEFIQRLLDAGLAGVEVASFVNPKAVPQMAGAADIMSALRALIDDKQTQAQISVLVPNMYGYKAAQEAGAGIISVVPSATETMNQKNINMSLEETLATSCAILTQADKDGVRGQAYISVAFECPFEGPVGVQQVLTIAERLTQAGAKEIIIGDTIGAANPLQVKNLFAKLTDIYPPSFLSAHFHDTRAMGLANAYAALECGIRKFDSSVGGLGGCPFAPGAAGNLATEDLVAMLHQMGFTTGIDLDKLLSIATFAGTLIDRKIGGRMTAWFAQSSCQPAM